MSELYLCVFFDSYWVPEPVESMNTPITPVRGIQIQNRFGLVLVYVGSIKKIVFRGIDKILVDIYIYKAIKYHRGTMA